MPDDLTPRQQQVLDYLNDQLARHGAPPTLREIARHLGVSGTLGVSKHLAALERKGYLHKRGGRARGIALSDAAAQPEGLPIVGTVRAGALQLASEDIEGYLSIDPALRRGGRFWLRVRGDSMIEAGIHDGDLALIRPQASAADGDIVVALLDGEATLKRFFHLGSHVRLQPENRALAPILVRPADGTLQLAGKLVGLFRAVPD